MFFKLFLFLFVSSNANASIFTDKCLNLRFNDHDYWGAQADELGKKIEKQGSSIGQYAISENVVKNVDAHIGHGASGYVYKVQLQDRIAALKLFKDYSAFGNKDLTERMIPNLMPTVIMQNTLANFGIGPKVYGLLEGKDLEALVQRFPQLKGPVPYRFGLLMEFVGDGASSKTGKVKTESINIERLKLELDQISKVLSLLRIEPHDVELTLSDDGHPMLIDMAFYKYVHRNGVYVPHNEYGNHPDAIETRKNIIAKKRGAFDISNLHQFIEPLLEGK